MQDPKETRRVGKLFLDGKQIGEGDFALLQSIKLKYCKQYGISKERAKKRFKFTY